MFNSFYNFIVPVRFLQWEIWVAFPGESQLQQSRATQLGLREKNPLPHRGIEPASTTGRSDTLPTELHPYPL